MVVSAGFVNKLSLFGSVVMSDPMADRHTQHPIL